MTENNLEEIYENLEERISYWNEYLPNHRFVFTRVDATSNFFCNIYGCDTDNTLINGTIVDFARIALDESLTLIQRGNPRDETWSAYTAAIDNLCTLENMFYVKNSKSQQTVYDEKALQDDDISVLYDLSVSALTSFVIPVRDYDNLLTEMLDFTKINWSETEERLYDLNQIKVFNLSKSQKKELTEQKRALIKERSELALKECEDFQFWSKINHCKLVRGNMDQNWLFPNLWIAWFINEPIYFDEYVHEVEHLLWKQSKQGGYVNSQIVNLSHSLESYPREYIYDGSRHVILGTHAGATLQKAAHKIVTLEDEELVIVDFNISRGGV